jgi:hypothetical protein
MKMIAAIKDKKNPKYKELGKVTNIKKAQENATAIYKELGTLFISEKKDKKFKIYDPLNKKWVHFGHSDFEDFLKHGDNDRRYRYLKRSTAIKGDWKANPWSANNLSIWILWN